jgi:hypothetical protein
MWSVQVKEKSVNLKRRRSGINWTEGNTRWFYFPFFTPHSGWTCGHGEEVLEVPLIPWSPSPSSHRTDRVEASVSPPSPSYGSKASNCSRARLRAYERGKVEGDGSGNKSVVRALRSILACSPASIHPAAAGIWGRGDGCSVTGEESKGEKLRKDGRC